MMKTIRLTTICALLLAAGACNRTGSQESATENREESEPRNLLYGIDADNYRTETGEVASGETLGKILNGYGVSAVLVDRLDKASADVFPPAEHPRRPQVHGLHPRGLAQYAPPRLPGL